MESGKNVTLARILAASALIVLATARAGAAELPMCSIQVINQVAKRIGCTIGDSRCWLTRGGMCTDYIQLKAGKPGKTVRLNSKIGPEHVRAGDVAQFSRRTHYAYVEAVTRDAGGSPISVDVSEYNYGSCWVDRSVMVTDQYRQVSRRSGVPLADVDGGFWRPEMR